MEWVQTLKSLYDKRLDTGQIRDFIVVAVGHDKPGEHKKEVDENITLSNEIVSRQQTKVL